MIRIEAICRSETFVPLKNDAREHSNNAHQEKVEVVKHLGACWTGESLTAIESLLLNLFFDPLQLLHQ